MFQICYDDQFYFYFSATIFMKKRKRGVEYNEEIPFEKRPPPGNKNHLHYVLTYTLYDPHICTLYNPHICTL